MTSYDDLSSQDLEQLCAMKAMMVARYEEELAELQEPSDVEGRLLALRGGVIATDSDSVATGRARAKILGAFVADIRDDHHQKAHECSVEELFVPTPAGPAVMSCRVRGIPHGRVPESTRPRGAHIGVEGALADSWAFVPDPWTDRGGAHTARFDWDGSPDRPSESSWGCGDVYVNRQRAVVLGEACRWQMAREGLPVCGDSPPVDRRWLQAHGIG